MNRSDNEPFGSVKVKGFIAFLAHQQHNQFTYLCVYLLLIQLYI